MEEQHVTRMSPHGLDWLASLEGGFRLEAYLDTKGIPTISAGLTFYPHSGRRVRLGDKIGLDWARELFSAAVQGFERSVDSLTTDDLLQHEFDALVAFTYNVGVQAYSSSTLAHLVNTDAPFPGIRAQFMRWVHSGGVVVNGLVTRRVLEAQVYEGGPYRDQGGKLFPVAPESPAL